MYLTTFDVLKKENGVKVPKTLSLRLIREDELDKLYEFMVKVKDSMGDSKNFSLEPRDQIFMPYEMGAKILGLFDEDGNIVGERYMTLLSHGKSEYALDVGLDEEDAESIIYLKSTVIDPDYTGNGLQYKTLEFAKDYCGKLGYSKFMSTISPFNLFSLKNGLQADLKIRALKKKYHSEEHPTGLWRYILFLDKTVEDKCSDEVIYIDRSELNKQIEYIENDYVGVNLSEDKEKIGYVRLTDKGKKHIEDF